MSCVVEWTEGRYAGIQQEIPSRCILGGFAHLSGGEQVVVKMGKSATAKKWKALFLRAMDRGSPTPDSPRTSLQSRTPARTKKLLQEPGPAVTKKRKLAADLKVSTTKRKARLQEAEDDDVSEIGS